MLACLSTCSSAKWFGEFERFGTLWESGFLKRLSPLPVLPVRKVYKDSLLKM